MALSAKQKKFIRRKFKEIPIEKLALVLKVSPQEIESYLNRKRPGWRKEIQWKSEKEKKEKNYASIKEIIKQNLVFIALLIFFVFLAYTNSLGNSFVSDDRGIFMDKNINNWIKIFTNPFHFTEKFLRGVVFTLFGYNPTAFRLINLSFHLSMVILVFLFLSLLFNRNLAFITASLFAVHPLTVESVVWISGVQYVIYPTFVILGLLLYHLWKKKKDFRFLWGSLFACVLALVSSEKAIIFPFMILLYELSFGRLKEGWKSVAMFFAISVLPGLYFLLLLPHRVQALIQTYYESPKFLNPLIQIPIALTSYWQLIFWPDKLTLYHSEMTFSYLSFLIRAVVTLFYFISLLILFFKNKKLFFLLSWFVVALLPYLTPFGISWIVAERYVYLSLVGILAFVGYVLEKLVSQKKFETVTWLIFYIILLSLTARTIVRNFDWKNEDTLWLATAKTSPSDPKTHNNLGDYYGRHGNLEKAAEEFKKAIQLKPNYADAYHNLANTYYQMGKLDLALKMYKKALSINPNLWQSYLGIAQVYQKKKDFKKAQEYLQKAKKLKAKLQQ